MRIFEALDRNRTWRVFRHAKAMGDILSYFGAPAWFISSVAVVAGTAMTWISSLPIWGKVIVGLVTILVVLIIAVFVSILRSPRLPEKGIEEVPSNKRGRIKAAIGIVASMAALVLAAVMSTTPNTQRSQTSPGKLSAAIPTPKQNIPPSVVTDEAAKQTAAEKPTTAPGRNANSKLPSTLSAPHANAPTPSVVNNAPGGIINSGSGTIEHATVNNNNGPVQRHLSRDQRECLEKVADSLPESAEKEFSIRIPPDSEALEFGTEIQTVFRSKRKSADLLYLLGGWPAGSFVVIRSRDDRAYPLAQRIVSGFALCDVPIKQFSEDSRNPEDVVVMVIAREWKQE